MRTLAPLLGGAAAAVLIFAAASARADEAEVVMVVGKAETRATPAGDWQSLAPQQKLRAGSVVRTNVGGQVALVLADQTQIRLNEQTQLRITAVGVDGEGTSLALERGRAWTQAKQYVTGALRALTGGLTSAQRLARVPLRVSTPTATVGIRGTDWELTVDDSGRTTVAVLSGEVELGNEHGQILVAANEQGVAERGRAPVKTLLADARDRVQWVTAYRPAPLRWVPQPPASLQAAVRAIEAGDYPAALPILEREAPASTAAALLLADLRLFQGRAGDAVTLLTPAAQRGDAMAAALRSRALALTGRLEEARAAAAPGARGRTDADRELGLALADAVRLLGDATQALRLFTELAAAFPQSADAWFGIGRIEGERENIRAARRALDEALRLAPGNAPILAERATVDTLANDFGAANAGFAEALKRAPDDYLAHTGLGILQLKTGENDKALESFLRAGGIEPRFARAQLYAGVAYYRLGRRERAIETTRKAAELDAKDPLPWVMLGLMRGDALQLGAAVDDAREAQARMPFLKSLNQILNDQKGSANLGSSLSTFGLEEWATYYAHEAYSPYWAGSHLFLADRHTGQFAKNSELFKGFITDPTVFGASNRFSSLVTGPGHYARADVFAERKDVIQGALIGTVNGLSTAKIPLAYYLSGDFSGMESRNDATQARGANVTLGVGAKPRHDIGIFAFGTDTDIRSSISAPGLPNDQFVQKENRADLGVNFKLTPTNQVWVKVGDGRQTNAVEGEIVSASAAAALNRAAAPFVFPTAGSLDRFQSTVTQRDLQFRHAFTAGDWQWTWGLERSSQDLGGSLATTFTGAFGAFRAPTTIATSDIFIARATDAYLGAKVRASESVELEGQLFGQQGTTRRVGNNTLNVNILGVPPPIFAVVTAGDRESAYQEFNPRLGIKWRIAERQTLRLVGQQWRRPASAAMLAPLDTLGLAVNDRLPVAGGLYERTRVQYDGELSPALFMQAFIDHERVDNGVGGARSAITDFQVTQLQSLRNRQDAFTPRPDLERTPVFANGTVRTFGLAANYRLGSRQTLSARYLYRESRQSGGANDGLAVPYMPKNYLLLGSQWALPDRWLIGLNAAYRSIRFRDDTNQDAAQHGWSYGLTAYWESDDKRLSVQGILQNLLSRPNAGDRPDAHAVLRFGYKF